MSIAILLAEPDLNLSSEMKIQLDKSSMPSEVLNDSKNWATQIQKKKFSHVILNYDLEKEVTDVLLTKLVEDHGQPKVILIISDAQRPFVKKSILENTSISKVLSFPYTIEQLLKCIDDTPAPKTSSYQRFEAVKNLTIKVIEDIYSNGLNEKNIVHAQKIGDSITLMIQKEKDFSEMIKNIDEYKPLIYNHPFLVCVFSMMICKKLKWDSPRTLSAISLGALIHDVGMTALPMELRMKSPKEMNAEELTTYRTHPREGINMVNKFGHIPSAVLQIILQHHEGNSKGFPNGISSVKIYPLAKVVSLSDKFTRFLFDNNLTPFAGLKVFLGDRNEVMQHEPDMIKALIKSFIKDEKNDSKEPT